MLSADESILSSTSGTFEPIPSSNRPRAPRLVGLQGEIQDGAMGLRTLAAQLVLGRWGGAFRTWHREVGNCRTSSMLCVSVAASLEKLSRQDFRIAG